MEELGFGPSHQPPKPVLLRLLSRPRQRRGVKWAGAGWSPRAGPLLGCESAAQTGWPQTSSGPVFLCPTSPVSLWHFCCLLQEGFLAHPTTFYLPQRIFGPFSGPSCLRPSQSLTPSIHLPHPGHWDMEQHELSWKPWQGADASERGFLQELVLRRGFGSSS